MRSYWRFPRSVVSLLESASTYINEAYNQLKEIKASNNIEAISKIGFENIDIHINRLVICKKVLDKMLKRKEGLYNEEGASHAVKEVNE